MLAQIFTQNTSPPLDTAARDLLATVDYLVRQAAPRGNHFDAAQVEMLKVSADSLRRELRAKARAA